MDLMTLAKGLDFDLGRVVMERVRFKRSYDAVILEITGKFRENCRKMPGWWDAVIRETGTCIHNVKGTLHPSDNVNYLYLQDYKGITWIDNVRSSYLIRKIQGFYDDPTIDWSSALVWNMIDDCEKELIDIWYYYWEDRTYTIQRELFHPTFDDGEHINMEDFDESGMERDRWHGERQCNFDI
jgi:hypothetical protein